VSATHNSSKVIVFARTTASAEADGIDLTIVNTG
jgi:hypothetical protein